MPIEFKDSDGVNGSITDALELVYYGRFSNEIEEFVSGLEGFSERDQTFDGEDFITHILLELPDAAPIVEVQRPTATR